MDCAPVADGKLELCVQPADSQSGPKRMKRANSENRPLYGKGPSAPKSTWRISPVGTYSFNSSATGSSYEAINSFFAGPTYIECLTCARAVALKADADVLGQATFD